MLIFLGFFNGGGNLFDNQYVTTFSELEFNL